MQRKSEFWLIGVVILVSLAVVVIPLSVVTYLEKIDEFFVENLNEEIGRCVNLEGCNLSNFISFLNHVCSERSYNLSAIYFYCNTTHLEIGNFYKEDINLSIVSDLLEEQINLRNGEVILYDLSEIGKEMNISYLNKEIRLSCQRKIVARDLCLSFLGSLKCISSIS